MVARLSGSGFFAFPVVSDFFSVAAFVPLGAGGFDRATRHAASTDMQIALSTLDPRPYPQATNDAISSSDQT